MKLFRGAHFGVFAGANGYYVASMASDGVSHYQPQFYRGGWSDSKLSKCNEEAREAEAAANEEQLV